MKSPSELAPVVLFVYNRLQHTKKTVKALQLNELAKDSELFIYSDAAKNHSTAAPVEEVRAYIKTVTGFKKITIVEREQNLGLAKSVIDGVTTVLRDFESVIVLEDDLITSPLFLKFMNDSLSFYQHQTNVYSITGFTFPSEFMKFPNDFNDDIYLNIRPMSWSWATWRKEWVGIDWEVKDFNTFMSSKKRVDQFNKGGTDLTHMLKAQMNGEVDSWYIRWTYNAFLKSKYTIYPRVSFVNNIGHDNTGVHCKGDSKEIFSHSELNLNNQFDLVKNIELNHKVVSAFNQAFNFTSTVKVKLFIKKVINYVKAD